MSKYSENGNLKRDKKNAAALGADFVSLKKEN